MTEPDLPASASRTRHPDPPESDRPPAVESVKPGDDGGVTDAERRQQLTAALAGTVLEAAARRLAEAVADYDAALDRHAFMPELRELDQEVARAERDHAAAAQQHSDGIKTDRRAP